MQISYGETRCVLLIGKVAIKLPRLRVLWLAKRFVYHLVVKKDIEKINHYVKRPKVITGIILNGIRANRNEAKQWQMFPRRFLVPTLYSFGFGLINIQRRGQILKQEELDNSHPFLGLLDDMPVDFVSDMTRVENFCRYQGRTCLVDYGSEGFTLFFSLPQPPPYGIGVVHIN